MHDPDTTPAGPTDVTDATDAAGQDPQASPTPEELDTAAQRLSQPVAPEDAPEATDEDLELGSATHVVLDGDVIRVDTATGQAPPDDEPQNVDSRDQVPSDEADDADDADETEQDTEAATAPEQDGDSK